MNFKLHTSFPDDLEKEWNGLLAESITHVPFLRFDYLRNWWQTRGGGEWPTNARLVIISAFDDGHLLGIAPLFQSQHDGKSALLFLGSIEISDYLDFIVHADDLAAFTSGLLFFLSSNPDIPPWDTLDFYNLLDSSPSLSHLEQAASALGWKFNSTVTNHAPVINLPGDWEEYLASLDKKQRHELRRKIRRLEEAEVPSRWYFVEDENTLDDEIDHFLALMAQDPEKEAFLTEEMVTAMAGTIKSAFTQGYLQLSFLEIDGQKAAAYLNFDYENHLWIYNSGLDRDFYSFSPGWVLLGYLLRWANENERSNFDFMRGDEDYKYRFGAKDRFVHRVTISKA
ncbi:MAG: GNAT family N-acetyltransferase [Anaerolineaceae bacterium]|nr:GNAT family N-acetyltransferase [Anaerolineaceae bacterium]